MDKIICLGKNYLEHAKELGDAVPEKPVLFLKPPSVLRAVESVGATLVATLPPNGRQGSCHHECEIVVKIKNGGYQIPLSQAGEQIAAVTLGLDMTLRDLQSQLKKNGHPWEISKVFPDSAIIGPWQPPVLFSDYETRQFQFELNGKRKQQAAAKDMSMKIAEAIAHASQFFTLCPGDLLFTGTPAGVGSVQAGDRARLSWGEIHYEVVWQ